MQLQNPAHFVCCRATELQGSEKKIFEVVIKYHTAIKQSVRIRTGTPFLLTLASVS